MKAYAALLVVALALVAVAAASPAKQYISEVEYADQLETEPNPSLVPHHLIESEAEFARKHHRKARAAAGKPAAGVAPVAGKQPGVAAQQPANKGKKSKSKKKAKKAAKKAKKLSAKVADLAKKAKAGSKSAAKALKKAQKKLGKALKKVKGKAGKMLKKAAKKIKAGAKKVAKKLLGSKKDKAAAKKARRAKRKAAKDRLIKSQQHTNERVTRAMDKIHHVKSSMSSLKGLLQHIHRNVEKLLPPERIRRYAGEDTSKLSNSRRGSLGKFEENRLSNPFSKDQSQSALYGPNVVGQHTPAVKKIDDMSAQDLAIKQIQLGKFTKKLVDRDTIGVI